MTGKTKSEIDREYFGLWFGCLFLENYKGVANLRRAKEFDKAQQILLQALPVPAVAEELRKIASARAAEAKKAKDWKAVIEHLESYLAYSDKVRAQSFELVTAPPPPLKEREQKMLLEAREKMPGYVPLAQEMPVVLQELKKPKAPTEEELRAQIRAGLDDDGD